MGAGGAVLSESEAARLSREGDGAMLTTTEPVTVLVLTGKPLNEPVVGRGRSS